MYERKSPEALRGSKTTNTSQLPPPHRVKRRAQTRSSGAVSLRVALRHRRGTARAVSATAALTCGAIASDRQEHTS